MGRKKTDRRQPEWFRVVLERWMTLCALAALALTALAYPITLDRALFLPLESLFGRMGAGWLLFFESNLRPALQFGYDPLVLKETLGAMAAALMAIGYVPWKLLYSPVRKERPFLHLPLLALLALAVCSVRWSPAQRMSFFTLEALLPAAVFFLMATDLDWGERGRRKLLAGIVAIGAALSVVGLLQTLPATAAIYYRFFLFIDDPRNWLGAWIGHNTELSAYVLSSMFAALALIFTTRSRLWRTVLGLHLILAGFIVIAAQSRSAWPIALALGGWAGWKMAREMGRRPRLIHALAVLAVVLALCLPIAGRLRARLHAYSPKALIAETRLRILAVSLPLIAEKPIFGHGIGSFVSVYPKAQGDYFAAHPDSRLVETAKRTMQAHDDYLQLLVELGVAGFAAFFLAVVVYVREGARGGRAVPPGRERVVSLAFLCIALQHGLNALVNFPAHVASSAYLFALVSAVWVALGREWAPAGPAAQRSLPRTAALRVALLVACALPASVAPLLLSHFAEELMASAHSQMGVGLLMAFDPRSGATAKDRWWAVDQAQAHFLAALRQDPLNWETLFHLAGVRLEQGSACVQEYQRLKTLPGQEKQAQFMRDQARGHLTQALAYLNQSLKEMTFHQSLQTAGQIYRNLAKIDADPSYEQKAIECLTKAVRYSGVYYDALRDLTREEIQQSLQPGAPPVDPAYLTQLGRRMLLCDPQQYRADFVDPALKRFWLLESSAAAQALQSAILVDPDNRAARLSQILSLCDVGATKEAAQALVALEEKAGKTPEYWTAYVAIQIAAGREDEALSAALANGARASPPDPWLAMLASLLLTHAGRGEEAQRIWAAVQVEPWMRRTLLEYRGYLALAWLRAPDQALADANAQIAAREHSGMAHYVRARVELERGEAAAARADAQQAISMGFNGEPARRLLALSVEASSAPASQGASAPAK
ncbi:MAG: O-antigen ligase family protein [Candidatus Sumerlaeota bacterium]|nr:O-antigen ligase family protein [Candidatus Sumerlaeota bacterium]